MTTLNRANREQYRRGPDEAFAAHNDLHDQCRQEKQNASDVWQPPHTLQPQLLERLTDAVNRLADEVRVVRDVLDETREDLGWLTRNGLPNQTTVHTQLVAWRSTRSPSMRTSGWSFGGLYFQTPVARHSRPSSSTNSFPRLQKSSPVRDRSKSICCSVLWTTCVSSSSRRSSHTTSRKTPIPIPKTQ